MGKSGKKNKARSDQPGGANAPAAPAASSVAGEARRPFWAKPIFWLGGIIVAALGVALTNVLVERFGEALEVVTETGPPLSVDLVGVSELNGGTVVVPADVPVDAADVESLNTLPPEQRADWFRLRDAAHPSSLLLDLVVSGTRADPVRIMDITPVTTCTTPADAGTLFYDPPAGGGEETIWLSFDLDSPRPVAIQRVDGQDANAPFFPSFTVPLKKNEQQVFTLQLSTEVATCSVELEISVLDGGELVTQKINDDGQPFRVTADLPRREWKQVYLGGVESCEGGLFHPAHEAWLREDLFPCDLW